MVRIIKHEEIHGKFTDDFFAFVRRATWFYKLRDKVVDFITTTLKSVISEQESTQAPTSVEDMTTQIPELSDETDDMKTMAPELEKEITTMQMIIDSVSEITTMVPESVPEMVPTDTRDKMPRLDDEGKINIFQNLIMLVF